MDLVYHTPSRTAYHVVFEPNYRRKVVYGKSRSEIRKILRECASYIFLIISFFPYIV